MQASQMPTAEAALAMSTAPAGLLAAAALAAALAPPLAETAAAALAAAEADDACIRLTNQSQEPYCINVSAR